MTDNYGSNDSGQPLGPMSTANIQTESAHYDSVWGAFEPSTWIGAPNRESGQILSRYEIPFEDAYLVSGCNLSCWQAQHPDWIMYACDNNGNPTSDLPWTGSGFPNDVPLNIHNQSVVNYQVAQLIAYMQSNGYNALAVDQVTFENFLSAPNPVLGESCPGGSGQCSQWYACGYYSSGPSVPSSFVRVYGSAGSSDHDVADPTFNQDILNWLSTAHSALAAQGLKLLVNHPVFDSSPNSLESQMLQYVDGIVVENGFTSYGRYAFTGGGLPGLFTQTLSWMQYAQTNNKAVFITDYYCYNGHMPTDGNGDGTEACSYDPSTLSSAQVDWALSTYAIANNGGADAYISPASIDNYSWRPEYATAYGAPCGAATQNGNVYMRQFQNGLAIVNASYTQQSVTLPAGNTYTDIENRGTFSGSMTLGPPDGYMLLLQSGTGCGASGSSVHRQPNTMQHVPVHWR